jgi:hypothetical protein
MTRPPLRSLSAAILLALATSGAALFAARTVELVLDASGSMNAKLPSGETRLAAAKGAVARIVPTLPADTTLAFRAYGHQSAREKHDCDDTQLLVPFGPLSGNSAAVVAAARKLSARGYTPISRVIRLAAADLAERTGDKAILLVSDGKETCDADPCATARTLKEADAADAAGLDGLAKALGAAAVAPMEKVAPMAKEPGNLEIRNAAPSGHDVLDAATGEKVGDISSFQREIKLPAGIYNIRFGESLWRGVQVTAKGRTVLEPAVLEIENPMPSGHEVVDSETGAEVLELSSFTAQGTLLPGLYDVRFGGTVWSNVRLDGGTRTTLRPGVLVVENASGGGHDVFDAAGRKVADVSSFGHMAALVPGSYSVEIGGRRVPFTLAEGQRVTLSAK